MPPWRAVSSHLNKCASPGVRLLRDERRVVAARSLLSKWGLGTYQLPPGACRQLFAVTLRMTGCTAQRHRATAALLAVSLPPRRAVSTGSASPVGAASASTHLEFVDEWERDERMTCQSSYQSKRGVRTGAEGASDSPRSVRLRVH